MTVGESVTVLLMALEGNRGGEPRFWVWEGDATTAYHRPFPRRYRLSIRRAAWPEAVDRYRVGQIVPAVVTEVQREFALLKLPGPVLGRANRTDVSGHHRHGGRMEDVIAEGDVVPVKVTFVNHAFFRLNVSYREARAETSAEGSWGVRPARACDAGPGRSKRSLSRRVCGNRDPLRRAARAVDTPPLLIARSLGSVWAPGRAPRKHEFSPTESDATQPSSTSTTSASAATCWVWARIDSIESPSSSPATILRPGRA